MKLNFNKTIIFDSIDEINFIYWVRNNFQNLNYLKIQTLIRKKFFKINEKKAQINDVLKNGDVISYPIFLTIENNEKTEFDLKLIQDSIIFENNDFIVIDKKSGIITQGHEESIANQTNLYIVHRLDKKASGLLILGKTKKFAAEFQKKLQNNDVQKEYLVKIDNLRKLPKETKFEVKDKINEKEAITFFEVIEIKDGIATLKANILNGRKHQIRKHCAYSGFPILGDEKYNGTKWPEFCLKCSKISFKTETENFSFVPK